MPERSQDILTVTIRYSWEEKKQEMYASVRGKIVDIPLTASPKTLDG